MNKRQKKKREKLAQRAKEIIDYNFLCVLTEAFKETNLLAGGVVPTKQEIIDALLTSEVFISSGYAKYILERM